MKLFFISASTWSDSWERGLFHTGLIIDRAVSREEACFLWREGGGMWWCKQFWRAPESRSSLNIKREDGRFWLLARTAAVIPRTPLWVCGCPQSACGLCVKRARALICPGLDWRKTLCGRPAAVSGRLGGPRCEVSPVMESVTVAQSSAFFFLLC